MDVEIYNKDHVPVKTLRKKEYAVIINLDKPEGPGSHWTCVRKTKNFLYYFDSYGFPPPQKMLNQFKKYKTPNVVNFYSDFEIQDKTSQRCGFYCLMALAYTKRTLPNKFDLILDKFDQKDKSKNDTVLYNLLNIFSKHGAENNMSGGSLIDWVINNLPFELHVPQFNEKTNTVELSNFVGPGTQLHKGKTRLNPDNTPKPWSLPKTKLDAAAMKHDIAYDSKQDRKKADNEFVQAADKIKKDPNEHAFNRLTAYITSSIIKNLGDNR